MTRLAALLAALATGPVLAQDAPGAPLSAIDWLSRSVDQPPPALPPEAPVAQTGSSPAVTVTPLDAPSPDKAGLLSPAETGLPETLWSASEEALLVTLIAAEDRTSLPAVQGLFTMLLLARAEPPVGAGPSGHMLIARIDRLLALGRLAEAEALIAEAGTDNVELFRRWFDITLLRGSEDLACAQMQSQPTLAPTLPARVFCLARAGDWDAAALTLGTARALGAVSDDDEELLTRFLDPALAEDMPALPRPERVSPLVFRLREAIGETLPTGDLPLAFAHADLRGLSAWRAEIEAAERLTRAGALEAEVLLGFYLAKRPAASGGLWDRAAAMQRLSRALDSGDGAEVSTALTGAAAVMADAGLLPALARLAAPRLDGLELTPEAGALAFRLALLTPGYEAAALAREPADPREALLAAIARGSGAAPATGEAEGAVRAAFAGETSPPELLTGLAAGGRLGEAILRTIALFNQGMAGDPLPLSEALATFRSLGLEDVARQAALQYLLLGDPR